MSPADCVPSKPETSNSAPFSFRDYWRLFGVHVTLPFITTGAQNHLELTASCRVAGRFCVMTSGVSNKTSRQSFSIFQ